MNISTHRLSQTHTLAERAYSEAGAVPATQEVMTTHRHIQIHNLLDTASSKARQCRRAADNLAGIRNANGAAHYLRRAVRFERIASACAARLEVA